MRISELFDASLMIHELSATAKADVISEMIEKLDLAGKLSNKAMYQQAVLDREAEYSTGIGMGIAIPHGKSSGVKEAALVFARSKSGVDFDSMDGKATHLLFLIAVPEAANDDHLRILGTLSAKLMHQSIREALLNAATYEEVVAVFDEA